MATIHYGINGEGRGHATRSRTVIEGLAERHDVRVSTYGDAYDLLGPWCRGRGIEIREIPGPRFRYRRSGRLDYLRSGVGGLGYLRRLPGLVRDRARELEREGCDLAIVDFEPTLARAAVRVGVPLVSLDHQHVLSVGCFQALPFGLRSKARLLGASVPLFVPRADLTLVSAFHHLPLRPGLAGVESVGVLLDATLRAACEAASPGEHLTAYFRREIVGEALQVLAAAPVPVHLFGLGERPDQGAIRFHAVDRNRFVEQLATGAALVCTAGNQVVGEAFALGKPALVIPEAGNFEQELNGWFLQASGGGSCVSADEFGARHLRAFLEHLPRLRAGIAGAPPPGNAAVQRALAARLGDEVGTRTAVAAETVA